MNNFNVKLLDDAYKNVRMGSYAIDCIIEKIKDDNLKNLIEKQDSFYIKKAKELEMFAQENKIEIKELNAMLKASSFVNINMKTLLNKDTPHIAEMLIQGTTMGITTLIKELNDSPEASEKLKEISNQIVANQEKFVESLKKFL